MTSLIRRIENLERKTGGCPACNDFRGVSLPVIGLATDDLDDASLIVCLVCGNQAPAVRRYIGVDPDDV